MPTYEYECLKCSNRYEKREGFDAPSVQRCPKCRGKAQRVIQAPPIVFKGSGFYVTDSRKAPVESDAGGSSPSSSSDAASSKDAPSSKDTEAATTSSD